MICPLQGELSVGTMASFIGYTFTLTFAVSNFIYIVLQELRIHGETNGHT